MTTTARASTLSSSWAPLRITVFRWLWMAQLASMIGTWMQTVGAQWLLVGEPNASLLVSLVQTANMVPVLLLALPAGVLADAYDRRRLLIVVQAFQLVVGAVLTALTLAGRVTPAVLLTLTFLLGCGAVVMMPAWQALTPELVPRSELPAASALGGVSQNLARVIGPAIAGVLVAQVGVAAVFALNTLSFAALAAALLAWRRPPVEPSDLPEPFRSAMRVGGRYVRHSPVVRRMLLRCALFVVPGAALWALLPLVASDLLGMDSSGYGLLLGAVGAGAVAGAFVLPAVRARLSTSNLLLAAGVVFAAGMAVTAVVRQDLVVALALLPVGTAWLSVLATLNASMQLFLPNWVRARGLSIYQVVFLGGQGLAAVVWGLLADGLGVGPTLGIAAGTMALGALSVLRWPLRDTRGLDRSTVVFWPEPHLDVEADAEEGPVLVTRTFRVAPEHEAAFLEAMEAVRRSRLRTGATVYRVYRDGADRSRFVEIALVPTWSEHLRQHGERLTGADQMVEERANALAEGPPEVAHLLPARPTPAPGPPPVRPAAPG